MAVIGINTPGLSLGSLFAIASLSVVGYLLSHVCYNVFFHPLRKFPGPFWMGASRISYCYRLVTGRLPFDILELHRQYGEVVRIAPNELAFANAQAWKDIMGHRGPGEPEMKKAPQMYNVLKDQPLTIVNAPRDEHGRLRRQLAHGFSDRSMREQQPIIIDYVNLLIRQLHERCGGGQRPIDAVAWYNYTTFDVIGDLAFGEPFGSLQSGEYHPWIAMIFQSIKLGTLFHLKLTNEKLLKRMDLGSERNDLIEGLLRKKDELNLDLGKLRMNASLLIIAGSETTATLLSGATYLLTTNPEALRRLTEEVRATFQTEEEIDFTSVSNLQYMLACLDEALRMYPPAPLGLPRQTPKGGATIAGHHVPEDTVVSQYHYALYHNEKFFTKPEEYHPERWLGDPEFATDNRDVFQPFHIGPRNCIGKNLAYIEMRIILARVLWNFDLKLADESKDWLSRQKIYLLWEKSPLYVYLTPRAHTKA
ncbi:hypothetical protein INS49_005167 [Diaporthe citri]|uniref:uncharacterized protein n=1 Tax=Diaporthe citri TaxID=83186 RepID=UPI001C7ECCBB|nr:uncharacterized protein INS49_005167 [Diaporthe citri]KAG6353910.1 hypothetical protein INS49_005167 [Diaporthe citri]